MRHTLPRAFSRSSRLSSDFGRFLRNYLIAFLGADIVLILLYLFAF